MMHLGMVQFLKWRISMVKLSTKLDFVPLWLEHLENLCFSWWFWHSNHMSWWRSDARMGKFTHDIQRPFHSGYPRAHSLKAQVVFLPTGTIGFVFIMELYQNDNGVQNLSWLNNDLLQLLMGIFLGGFFLCIYCDGIFASLATILPSSTNPTPELHLLNQRLASLLECIEHIFPDHKNRFQLFGGITFSAYL